MPRPPTLACDDSRPVELAADFYFEALERIGGSKLIFSFGHLAERKQVKVIQRLFGRRGVKVTFSTNGIKEEFYYLLMPSKKSQLIVDIDTGESELCVSLVEVNATGSVTRGKKNVWPRASGDDDQVRFSLTKFEWVKRASSPSDDVDELRKTYFIPEWFAPIYGTHDC